VIPQTASLLKDIQAMVGYELNVMKQRAIASDGKSSVDWEGGKLRNLMATVQQAHEVEKEIENEDLSGLSKKELAARHREEAARLELEDE
jgi:hypothetical protein